jgi:hypothetical protein
VILRVQFIAIFIFDTYRCHQCFALTPPLPPSLLPLLPRLLASLKQPWADMRVAPH